MTAPETDWADLPEQWRDAAEREERHDQRRASGKGRARRERDPEEK